MFCSTIALLTGFLFPLAPSVVNATTQFACNNKITQTWSPAPGVTVTVSASVCNITVSNHFYGVHGIASSTNSNSVTGQYSNGYFWGNKYNCGYYCDPNDSYVQNFSTGSGQFSNFSGTFGSFRYPGYSPCAITNIDFTVLYIPTNTTHSFTIFIQTGVCP
jgi:hypothetical protein